MQDLLHLGRRHVDARALDHLRAPPRTLQGAVLPQQAEIAGPKVAVRGEDRCVELRTVAEIALHQISAHLDLSDLGGSHVATCLRVTYAQLYAGQGDALACRARLERRIVRRDTAVAVVLGGAVDIADL